MSLIARPLGFMGGRTYAQLSTTDKNAAVTVSGTNNLTATWSAAAGYSSIRANLGCTTGKRYAEFTLNVAGTDGFVGVGLSSATLNSYCGNDANGLGVEDNGGNRYNNASASGYAGWTLAGGDIVSVAVDFGTGAIDFWKNSTPAGALNFSIYFTGTVFIMLSGNNSTSWIANFGQSAMTYAPPSGYEAGIF